LSQDATPTACRVLRQQFSHPIPWSRKNRRGILMHAPEGAIPRMNPLERSSWDKSL